MTGEQRQELKTLVSAAVKDKLRSQVRVDPVLRFPDSEARAGVCRATRFDGNPCQNRTENHTGFCYAHEKKSEARS